MSGPTNEILRWQKIMLFVTINTNCFLDKHFILGVYIILEPSKEIDKETNYM